MKKIPGALSKCACGANSANRSNRKALMKPEKLEDLEKIVDFTRNPLMLIEIPGEPIPWSAPTVMRKGHAYSKHSKKKAYIQWLIKSQYRKEPITGPIFLIIFFDMPIPASYSPKKTLSVINKPHQNKPDCTNLQKFIEDCLTGIIFVDDKQVWKIFSEKKYSEKPKTVIYIQQLCQQPFLPSS